MREYLPLADLCVKITKGTTPSASDGGFTDSGLNYIKSESLSYNGTVDTSKFSFISEDTNRRLRRSIIEEGDILYSIAGANLGKCGIARHEHLPANTNQAVAIIRVDREKASPRFISFCLRNPSFVQAVLGGVAQSAQPNVNLAEIGRFSIPLMPLAEQRAIAATLGALDDKIELNRRMNATLEALARALFRDWFVDFGPTRAKMAGAEPYLSPDLWSLFPDRLDDEGKPERWEVVTIGSLAHRVTKGTTPTKQQVTAALDEASINFLRVNNLSEDGTLLLGNIVKVAQSVHEGALKRSVIQPDDILYSIAGTIGRVVKVSKEVLPANVNQALAIIRPNSEVSPPNYLLLWLSDEGFQQELHSNIIQAVQANLSLGMLSDAKILLPPREALASLLRPFDALLERKAHNDRESLTLAQTRDLLLPRLMSGEVKVSETTIDPEIEA